MTQHKSTIVFSNLAALGIAVPNFVLAGISIIIFVFWLNIFPAAGWGKLNQIILPALCVGAPYGRDVRVNDCEFNFIRDKQRVAGRPKLNSRTIEAVLRPIPGSLLNSVARVSMADMRGQKGSLKGSGRPPVAFPISRCCSS